MSKDNSQPKYPIARIVGLLSLSGMTLAGVAVSLPPDVILFRTAVGTGMAIMIAQLFAGLIRFQTS